MQPGIPGSAPPASVYPGGSSLGPQAGVQANQKWNAGEVDDRPLLSAMRAPHLWRVTLHGENVRFRVSWGTSSNIVVTDVNAPARFVVPGAVDVYARPIDSEAAAHAEVTLTPATSGTSAILRSIVLGPAAPLSPNAARFVALVASVVQVGSGGSSFNVNLNVNESVLLVSGSTLTSGGGYQEFEP